MNPNPKIVVAGSLNMDMVISTDHLPVLGETVRGRDFFMNPGGKGANQAVGAARLGAKVALVGCRGDDQFGKTIEKALEADGVDITGIRKIETISTGTAVVLIEGGNNCIVVSPGANHAWGPAEISFLEHILPEADFLLVQLEIPMKAVVGAIETANRLGVPVLLNPAPACNVPESLLAGIAVLMPNETEAAMLTGLDVSTLEGCQAAAHHLRAIGVGAVVITRGGQGAFCSCAKSDFSVPAYQVSVADTTAAGDSCCAALAVALGSGVPIERALPWACAAAALTVTRKGAQVSLPTAAEVAAFLKNQG
jgi:ribokinase